MFFDRIYPIFAYCTAATVFIPLILLLQRAKAAWNDPLHRVILLYLVTCVIAEAGYFFSRHFIFLNDAVDICYSIAQFFLITEIILRLNVHETTDRTVIVLGRIFVTCGTLTLLLFIGSGLASLFYNGFSGCFFVALAIRVYYLLMVKEETLDETNLWNSEPFLVITAVMLFFSSTFFVLLYDSLTQSSSTIARVNWSILLAVTIVFYLLISRAVWLKNQTLS